MAFIGLPQLLELVTCYCISLCEARLDIRIGSVDQVAKACSVEVRAGLQFYVPHALAASFQEAGGIFEQCPVEKANVDVVLEGVDVPERRIFDARDGAAIVHQFADVIATAPHLCEPKPGDGPKVGGIIAQPSIDSCVPLRARREPKELHAVDQTADIQSDASSLAHTFAVEPCYSFTIFMTCVASSDCAFWWI